MSRSLSRFACCSACVRRASPSRLAAPHASPPAAAAVQRRDLSHGQYKKRHAQFSALFKRKNNTRTSFLEAFSIVRKYSRAFLNLDEAVYPSYTLI